MSCVIFNCEMNPTASGLSTDVVFYKHLNAVALQCRAYAHCISQHLLPALTGPGVHMQTMFPTVIAECIVCSLQ